MSGDNLCAVDVLLENKTDKPVPHTCVGAGDTVTPTTDRSGTPAHVVKETIQERVTISLRDFMVHHTPQIRLDDIPSETLTFCDTDEEDLGDGHHNGCDYERSESASEKQLHLIDQLRKHNMESMGVDVMDVSDDDGGDGETEGKRLHVDISDSTPKTYRHLMSGIVAEDESDEESEDDSRYDEDMHIECIEMMESILLSMQEEYFIVNRIHGHTHTNVYKAIDRRTFEAVCIKMVARHNITADNINSVPIEVRVLSRIARIDRKLYPASKHLQRIRAYHSNDYAYVIVSDLSAENSFSKTLFDNPDDTRTMIRQLLGAVDVLHKHGIIYRDMKPSNIMWDSSKKNMVLIDFDLATFDVGKHFVTLGTDCFLAPEVSIHDVHHIKQPPAYTNKIDIYGVGLVLGSILFRERETAIEDGSVKCWRKKIKKKLAVHRKQKKQHDHRPDLVLLRSLVAFHCNARPTAEEALCHEYFKSGPPKTIPATQR